MITQSPSPPASSERIAFADAENEQSRVLPLVRQLCDALINEGIKYCHWKSNEAIGLSASGDNDLDLLVDRGDVNPFLSVLGRLGFKEARPAADKDLPGVFHYFGYDSQADRFVHVHAHYQLVLGHDATKNYHLPIEREYLDSSMMDEVFPLPSAEFEFVVFVVRMMLKHATWDAIVTGQGRLSASERRELNYLLERIDPVEVDDILRRCLPHISPAVFDQCTDSLASDRTHWSRWRAGVRLLRELRPNARCGACRAFALKWWRIGKWGTRRFILRIRSRKKLAHGGAIIALVGADGCGKSSAIKAAHKWLSPKFHTQKRHMGKPPWSLRTCVVKAAIKAYRMLRFRRSEDANADNMKPSFDVLLWHVVTAYDRYRNYLRARRFASNGGIVLCDRFPLAEVRSMDRLRSGELLGNRRPGRLMRLLAAIERRCYSAMLPPDVLIILRVTPDVAVARRSDEPEQRSRSRSEEILSIDWSESPAHIVDADQSLEHVHRAIKRIIWDRL